tara:strand:- start:40 stop:2556 length:2517 start_codon:yes stop_codon:yes gene_type:complete
MREGITKVDLNFTNAGGGHTASVTSVANPKSIESGENLGIVVGELGESNNFSNSKITDMLGNFICTSKTVSANATRKVVTRRYVDRTSLILESYIILVRGVNAGPDGGNQFEGPVSYFTEVKGSPLKSFRSQGPVVDSSVIYLGRIYNVESAANFEGVKMSLVYNNGELKENLCLNSEFISDSYKNAPDLSQYDLKFGYTLSDFKSALERANIRINGLPSDDKILFEISGTLSSVISSVAGSLGYFWYVNPKTGTVEFVNSDIASQLPIDSYVNTTDSNILNASYTESTVFNKIVNTYSGSTEKDSNNPKDDDRPRPIFFKRCRWEKYGVLEKASINVLGSYFSLFEQEENNDIFDKFTYFCTAIAKNAELKAELWDSPNAEPNEKNSAFDLSKLYPYEPLFNADNTLPFWDFVKTDNSTKSIFKLNDVGQPTGEAIKAARKTRLKGMNRITNKFKYLNLTYKDIISNKKMPRPHTTELYGFLKLYFQIAGGVYISNGYSDYKSERMEFSNSNMIAIVGPVKGDKLIAEIPELSTVSSFLENLDVPIKDVTVKKLALKTQAEGEGGRKTFEIGRPVETLHDNFFIAIRSLPKLERDIPLNNQKIVQNGAKVDFTPLEKYYEILDRPKELFIGGPSFPDNILDNTLVEGIKNLIKQSTDNFIKAVSTKKSLRLSYKRSKTRVNKTNEDGEEQEDDQIAGASERDQKIADLFDRYDLKYNSIESPSYNALNKLSLSSASGSTAEMKVLQQMRGKYRDRYDKPQSSSRTFYGLHIPEFSPTMNSVSISVGNDGITTTVSESTIKLIPPEQSFMITEGMEALTPKSMLPKAFNARQRNTLGL